MSAELAELLEEARWHVWTPAEHRAHAISFAWGNLALDGCNVTRKMLEAEYERLHGVGERKERDGWRWPM